MTRFVRDFIRKFHVIMNFVLLVLVSGLLFNTFSCCKGICAILGFKLQLPDDLIAF